MRDNKKFFPVNWIDGMKINKNHFIEQDNAWTDNLHDANSIHLSPIRFGILEPSVKGGDSINVKIAFDNQNALKVTVLACEAVTQGGMRISLPVPTLGGQKDTGNFVATTFTFSATNNEGNWWVFLTIHPFEKQTVGSPDIAENPPRFPYLLPTHTLQLVNDLDYHQFANHPYAIAIGKLSVSGNTVKIDQDYIPPCFSTIAHPDLAALHAELDKFLTDLELYCSVIVQKIFKRNQQNEISDLVQFLCDRVMMQLTQLITAMRWTRLYEPPVMLFADMSSLARVMKNSIDLRIGSGKDELMNYLTEWCELKQGELESLFGSLTNTTFDNNDTNKNIQKVAVFVRITSRLFETLSKLEFIGKKKDTGIFVKEEPAQNQSFQTQQTDSSNKPKRRFFGT